jgi:hypothetical protein
LNTLRSIPKVPGSNLDPEIVYINLGSLWFSSIAIGSSATGR